MWKRIRELLSYLFNSESDPAWAWGSIEYFFSRIFKKYITVEGVPMRKTKYYCGQCKGQFVYETYRKEEKEYGEWFICLCCCNNTIIN